MHTLIATVLGLLTTNKKPAAMPYSWSWLGILFALGFLIQIILLQVTLTHSNLPNKAEVSISHVLGQIAILKCIPLLVLLLFLWASGKRERFVQLANALLAIQCCFAGMRIVLLLLFPLFAALVSILLLTTYIWYFWVMIHLVQHGLDLTRIKAVLTTFSFEIMCFLFMLNAVVLLGLGGTAA